MNEDSDSIRYETGGDGVATLWLNRPDKRNSIHVEMLHAMNARLSLIERDPALHVLVIRGAGGNFCGGGDLESAVDPSVSAVPSEYQRMLAALFNRIQNFLKPTVAVVEGYATGGGLELMLACDFAIAADDAWIGDYHVNRALVAGCGLLYRLPRVLGLRKAKELVLTGKLLSGRECAEWGLVNSAAPADMLESEVEALCRTLAGKSSLCMQITKLALNQSMDAGSDMLALVETLTVNLMNQSADTQEGIAAFLEKRSPQWKGR
ncbi:MAG: enoyl-CoA hydratase/isomerase family protein [Sphingobium sp.]